MDSTEAKIEEIRPGSSVEPSVERLKADFGDRCRTIRRQGDYEFMIKVELPQKYTVHVAVPYAISSASQLDILVRGGTDLAVHTRLERALHTFAASMPTIAIYHLFRFAEQWLLENLPSVSVAVPDSEDIRGDSAVPQPDHPQASSSSYPRPCRNCAAPQPKAVQAETSSSRKPSLKTAADVISRIRWDTELASEHFVIGYLDRFRGILEKPFNEFNWADDFVDVDLDTDFAVPQHRIQYFKYKSALIWDKKERFDAVFGSCGSGASLRAIMRLEDAKTVDDRSIY